MKKIMAMFFFLFQHVDLKIKYEINSYHYVDDIPMTFYIKHKWSCFILNTHQA